MKPVQAGILIMLVLMLAVAASRIVHHVKRRHLMKTAFVLFAAALTMAAPVVQAFEPNWGERIEIRPVPEGNDETTNHQFRSPAWAPDGESLVFVNMPTGIYLVGADGGTAELLYSDPIPSYIDPTFTPDGTEITFSHLVNPTSFITSTLSRLIIGSINIETRDYREFGFGKSASWNPDGRYLVYTFLSNVYDPEGDALIVLDTVTGTETKLLTLPANIEGSPTVCFVNPVFLPYDSAILYTFSEGSSSRLYRIPASGGTPVPVTGTAFDCSQAVAHTDGNHAVAVQDSILVWVDLNTGSILPLTPATEEYRASYPAISPDGQRVCFVYCDPTMEEEGRIVRQELHVLDLGDLVQNEYQTAVETIPAAFPTLGAYPNPFNPATTLSFTVPASEYAELSIFNVAGQKVRTLVAGEMTAGAHQAVWDGRNDQNMPLASGMFIAQVKTGGVVISSRITLIK